MCVCAHLAVGEANGTRVDKGAEGALDGGGDGGDGGGGVGVGACKGVVTTV